MNPCPHCGALPSGELMGLSVFMHAKDCPNCPQWSGQAVEWIMAPLPNFLCGLCGCTADTEKELQHSPACPANPLTN